MQLIKLTAQHVSHYLEEAMLNECNGCILSHGSQLQHSCLMLNGEDRIKFCLDRALLLAYWEKLKKVFVQSYLQFNFYDKEWFQTLWADAIWYDQLVSALLAQECQSDI